ncbi:Uncharacterized protein dnm_054420 [Desulfonema magnum]|uniref:Uncharacterized protein n=1 Tax=Desulfonema magnum TaxID=45655 RepID=A0A975BPS3_9BACT|nr:Uncharacterized protein dnm_054420 [Desulfonema magnum]
MKDDALPYLKKNWFIHDAGQVSLREKIKGIHFMCRRRNIF